MARSGAFSDAYSETFCRKTAIYGQQKNGMCPNKCGGGQTEIVGTAANIFRALHFTML